MSGRYHAKKFLGYEFLEVNQTRVHELHGFSLQSPLLCVYMHEKNIYKTEVG